MPIGTGENIQRALECFEQGYPTGPGDNMAWLQPGIRAHDLRRIPEAVNTFDLFLARYSKKDDFYKYALYMKAKGLYSLKKYDESLKLTKKALKKDKKFKEARELMNLIGEEKTK